MLIIFSFFIVKPPTVLYCLFQNIRIKSETPVSLNTGLNIIATRHTDRSVLVHNVNVALTIPCFSVCEFFNRECHFRFVIKNRKPLVPVKCRFVSLCGFPHGNRNNSAVLWFNGKIWACFTFLKSSSKFRISAVPITLAFGQRIFICLTFRLLP